MAGKGGQAARSRVFEVVYSTLFNVNTFPSKMRFHPRLWLDARGQSMTTREHDYPGAEHTLAEPRGGRAHIRNLGHLRGLDDSSKKSRTRNRGGRAHQFLNRWSAESLGAEHRLFQIATLGGRENHPLQWAKIELSLEGID